MVESTSEELVYGYGNGEMSMLMPGESTDPLTNQIKMLGISNADFSNIDDVSVTITGYGIDTEGDESSMRATWERCKELK